MKHGEPNMTKTTITFDRDAFQHAMRKDLLLIKAQAVCVVIAAVSLAVLLFT